MSNNSFDIEQYVNNSLTNVGNVTDISTTRAHSTENLFAGGDAPAYGFIDWARDAASAYYRSMQEGEMQEDLDRMLEAQKTIGYIDDILKYYDSNDDDEDAESTKLSAYESLKNLRDTGVWTEKNNPSVEDLQKLKKLKEDKWNKSNESYLHNKEQYEDSVNNYDISQYYTRKSNEAVLSWGNWEYKLPATMGTSMTSPFLLTTSMAASIAGAKIGAAAGTFALPGLGTAAGTIGGALGGLALGLVFGGMQSRENESHMEAFNGYYERVVKEALEKGVDLTPVVSNVREQLELKGISTQNMNDSKIIQAALADPSLKTGSSAFDAVTNDAYKGSRRLYERNNALGFGEALSDLTYILPLPQFVKEPFRILGKVVSKAGGKVVPNVIKTTIGNAINKRFMTGVGIASAGAAARNKALIDGVGDFLKASAIRGTVEATEEGAQHILTDQYIRGLYDDEQANDNFGDALTSGQVFSDLVDDVWFRARSLGAVAGLDDEYKDDQQMFEEMLSGFLMSWTNPQGLVVNAAKAHNELRKLLSLPKVSKYLENSLRKQDAVNRNAEFLKAIREGLPSGNTWNEALDMLRDELKSVGPDGKTRKYNLDSTVITDGVEVPTDEDIDEVFDEQKENANALFKFRNNFIKKHKNLDVSPDDLDLYMSLAYLTKNRNDLFKLKTRALINKLSLYTREDANNQEFRNTISDMNITKDLLDELDYENLSRLVSLVRMNDFLDETLSESEKSGNLNKAMNQSNLNISSNALNLAKSVEEYTNHKDEVQKAISKVEDALKEKHPDINLMFPYYEDTFGLTDDELAERGVATAGYVISRASSRISEGINEQFEKADIDFVNDRVSEYKKTQKRQQELADKANAAARTNTEVPQANVAKDKVIDMTKELMLAEEETINNETTQMVDLLKSFIDLISEESYLSGFVEFINNIASKVGSNPMDYARAVSRAVKRVKSRYDNGLDFENASDEDKLILKNIVDLSSNIESELDRLLTLNTEARAKANRHDAGLHTNSSNSVIWEDPEGGRYTIAWEDIEYSENEGGIITLRPVSTESKKYNIDEQITKTEKALENEREKAANDAKIDHTKQIKALESALEALKLSKSNDVEQKLILNMRESESWLKNLKFTNNKGEEKTFEASYDIIEKNIEGFIEENKKHRHQRANMAWAEGDMYDFLLYDHNGEEAKKNSPAGYTKGNASKVSKTSGNVLAYPLPDNTKAIRALLNAYYKPQFWNGHYTVLLKDKEDAERVLGQRVTFKRNGIIYNRGNAVDLYRKIGERIAKAKRENKHNAQETYTALKNLYEGKVDSINIHGIKLTKEKYTELLYALPVVTRLYQPRYRGSLFLPNADFGGDARLYDYSENERLSRANLIHTLLNNYKYKEDAKKTNDESYEIPLNAVVDEDNDASLFDSRVTIPAGAVKITTGDFNYQTKTERNKASKLFQNEDGSLMKDSEVYELYKDDAPFAVEDFLEGIPELKKLLNTWYKPEDVEKLFTDNYKDPRTNEDTGIKSIQKLTEDVLRYGDGVIGHEQLSETMRHTIGLLEGNPSTKVKGSSINRARDMFLLYAKYIPEHFRSFEKDRTEFQSYTNSETVRIGLKNRWFTQNGSIKLLFGSKLNNGNPDMESLKPVNLFDDSDENIKKVTGLMDKIQDVFNDSKTADEFLNRLYEEVTDEDGFGLIVFEKGETKKAAETLTEYFDAVKFGRLAQNGNIAQVISQGESFFKHGNKVQYDKLDRITKHVFNSLTKINSLGLKKDETGRYYFSINYWIDKNVKQKDLEDKESKGEKVEELENLKKEKVEPLRNILSKVNELYDLANNSKAKSWDNINMLLAQYEVTAKKAVDAVRNLYYRETNGIWELKDKKHTTKNTVLREYRDNLEEEIDSVLGSDEFQKVYFKKQEEEVYNQTQQDDVHKGSKRIYLHYGYGSFETKEGSSIIEKDEEGNSHEVANHSGTPGAIYLEIPASYTPFGYKIMAKLNPQYLDDDMAGFVATLLNMIRTGEISKDTYLNDVQIGNYHVKSSDTVKAVLDEIVYNGLGAFTNNPTDENLANLLNIESDGSIVFGENRLTDDNFIELVEFLKHKTYEIKRDKIIDINAVNGIDINITTTDEEGNEKVMLNRNKFDLYATMITDEGRLLSDLPVSANERLFAKPRVYTSVNFETGLKPVATNKKATGSALNAKETAFVDKDEVVDAVYGEKPIESLYKKDVQVVAKEKIKEFNDLLKKLTAQGILEEKPYKVALYNKETHEHGIIEKIINIEYSKQFDSDTNEIVGHVVNWDNSGLMFLINKAAVNGKSYGLLLVDDNNKFIKTADNKTIGVWINGKDINPVEAPKSPEIKEEGLLEKLVALLVADVKKGVSLEMGSVLSNFSAVQQNQLAQEALDQPVVQQSAVLAPITINFDAYQDGSGTFSLKSGLSHEQFQAEMKSQDGSWTEEDGDYDRYLKAVLSKLSGASGFLSMPQSGNTATETKTHVLEQPVGGKKITYNGGKKVTVADLIEAKLQGTKVESKLPVVNKTELPSVEELFTWASSNGLGKDVTKIKSAMAANKSTSLAQQSSDGLSTLYGKYLQRVEKKSLLEAAKVDKNEVNLQRARYLSKQDPSVHLAAVLNFFDKHVEKENYQEAIKTARQILGDSFRIEALDKISTEYDLAREANLYIYGQCCESAIYIYKALEDGQEMIMKGGLYHEAFHRISLFYLSKQDRKKMYAQARIDHPELADKSDMFVEEFLADEFAAQVALWKANKDQDVSGNIIKKIFKKISDFVKKIVTKFRKHHLTQDHVDMNKLFSDMYAGRYAYAKATKDNIEEFRKVYSGKFVADGVKVDDITIAEDSVQYVQIKRDLIAKVIRNSGLTQDANGKVSANMATVRKEIQLDIERYAGALEMLEQYAAMNPSELPERIRLIDLMDYAIRLTRFIDVNTRLLSDDVWNIWSENIKDFCNLKFNVPVETADEQAEGKTEEGVNLGISVERDSVSRDMFSEADVNMKALLWSIVDGDVNNPANMKFTEDGLQIYAQVSLLYNRIVRTIAGANTVEEMLELLRVQSNIEAETGDYTMQQFYQELMPESANTSIESLLILRNNVFGSFNLHIHDFENSVYEATEHVSVEDGKDKITYTYLGSVRNGSLDTVSNSIKLVWKTGLISAFTSIANGIQSGVIKYDKLKEPITDTMRKLRNVSGNTAKENTIVQELLKQLSETYGITFKDNDYKHVADKIQSDKTGVNKLLAFAKSLTDFKESAVKQIAGAGAGRSRFNVEFQKLVGDIKSPFFAFSQLLAKDQTPEAKENSQPGPNNTKIFSFGAFNFITRLFDTRMKLKSWKDRMNRNIYAAHSHWLKLLTFANANPKVLTKLSTVIDNDFSDAVADIDTAPHEDLMNRMFTILAKLFNSPSLANKRFAAAFEGFSMDGTVINSDLTINPDVIDRYAGYLADEILAIADAKKTCLLFIDKLNEALGLSDKDKYTIDSFSKLSSTAQEKIFRENRTAGKLLGMLKKQYHYKENGEEFVEVDGRLVRRVFHVDLRKGTGKEFRSFKNLGVNIEFTDDLVNKLTEHRGAQLSARTSEIKLAESIANKYKPAIMQMVNKNIVALIEKFMQEDLIEKQSDINPLTAQVNIDALRNKAIPENAFEYIDEKYTVGNRVSGNLIYRLLATFEILDSFGLFEFEKVVTGDKGFHKNETSVNKRYSGPCSTTKATAETGSIRNAFMGNDRLYNSPTYNTLMINTSLVVNKAKFEGDMLNAVGVNIVTGYYVNKGRVEPTVDASLLLETNAEGLKVFKNPDAPLVRAFLSHKQMRRTSGLDNTGKELSIEALAEKVAETAVTDFDNYLNIDPTDALVFISAEMFRQNKQREGKWSYYDEACYDLLENYDNILPLSRTHEQALREMCEMLKISYDTLIEKATLFKEDPKTYGESYKGWIYTVTENFDCTSLKYVYYGESTGTDDGLYDPIYDKMSETPIFKIWADGHQMGDVYKFMKKNQVDVIKTESAVKSAGVPCFEMFDKHGKFNSSSLRNAPIQQQYFALHGKQLNTDPHPAGETALLTQFMKIANMNIQDDGLYYIGKELITGQALKLAYGHIIDDLTMRGQTKFLKAFGLTKDGDTYKLNKAKFMSKLKLMGITQDLPMDTLAAFDVDPVTGDFRIHPSAMPNLKWIQSRLISEMGKKVIETVTPGMPLYQVSSVGYDNIFNIKQHKDVHLRMPGEDGSKHMEVKLSIKFFGDIINDVKKKIANGEITLDPKYGNLETFDKQRRFILDNQELFALSYRVPTQGQNSTIPIKIVDVFPPQRGGIIMFPAGVTALTGSDFDIDKMYLARYNYTVNKHGKLEKVKYSMSDYIFGNMNQTTEQLQNMLLDIYFGVLTSPYHYLSANVPLDVCTAPLSNFAKSVANVGKVMDNGKLPEKPEDKDLDTPHLIPDYKNKTFDAYIWNNTKNKFVKEGTVPMTTAQYEDKIDMYHSNPVFQTAQKLKNAGSDGGIGPMALNSVFRYFAQVANLQLLPDEYLQKYGITRIDAMYDRNGVDILDITSALINAHVDAVKDNYIGNVNVNGYTFDVTAFLTSTGFGNDTFAFLCQPILKDLAETWLRRRRGTVVADPEQAKGQGFMKEVKERWVAKLEKSEEVNSLASADEMNIAYLKDHVSKYKTQEDIKQQLRYLNTFTHLFSCAEYYHNLISVAQIDTKKYGKSADELISFTLKYYQAISPYNRVFKNPEDIFDKTFLGTKWNNGVQMLLHAFDNVLFEFSDLYVNSANALSRQYGKYGKYSANFMKRVGPRLKAAYLAPFFNDYIKSRYVGSQIPLRRLFAGSESVPARYSAIKQKCIEKGIGLNFFQLVTYSPLVLDTLPLFFRVDDSIKSDEDMKNQLLASMSELFNSGDAEIVQWMNDFTAMMFYQTGGTDTNAGGIIKTTVFDLIPPQFLANLNNGTQTYNEFVSDLFLSSNVDQDKLDQAMMMVALTDDSIIATVDERLVKPMLKTKIPYGTKTREVNDVVYIGYGSDKVALRSQGTFSRFIKVRSKSGEITLYKLGNILTTGKEGGKSYNNPLYFRVNTLGYRNRGISAYSVRTDGEIVNGRIKSLFGNDDNAAVQTFSDLTEKQQQDLLTSRNLRGYKIKAILDVEPIMNYGKYFGTNTNLGEMAMFAPIDAADVICCYNDPTAEQFFKNQQYNYAESKYFGENPTFNKLIIRINNMDDLKDLNIPENTKVALIGTYKGENFEKLKAVLPQSSTLLYYGNVGSSDSAATDGFINVMADTDGSTTAQQYHSRTVKNAEWSDITIALAEDFSTKGEKLTKDAAADKYVSANLSKGFDDSAKDIASTLFEKIKAKGKIKNIKLNIAGNGLYNLTKSQGYYNGFIRDILWWLQDKGITISEVRSGGQTGIDEAGIKAADALGIKWSILAPREFWFKDKNGNHSGRAAFMKRFEGLKYNGTQDVKQTELFKKEQDEDYDKNPFEHCNPNDVPF